MKWNKTKVLVTGGAGFIGCNIAKKLLEKNAEVVVLDNFAEGKRENIPEYCDVIEGDVRDVEVLQRIKDVDYVFHFGAPSSIILFNQEPKKCVDVTVCGFINILEWAYKSKVKKVVFPTSGSVYGSTPPPQSEEAIVQPKNLYGVAKLVCENVAKLYMEKIPIVGLRIFAGYGPDEAHKGNFASPVTLFLNSIGKGERPVVYGNGSQSRDFVYIDDIVEAVLRAAEGNLVGIVNIGSGKSYTFNEVISAINDVLHKNISPTYIEQPTNYLERTLADTGKMNNLLNLFPVDLKVGLKKYLDENSKRTKQIEDGKPKTGI